MTRRSGNFFPIFSLLYFTHCVSFVLFSFRSYYSRLRDILFFVPSGVVEATHIFDKLVGVRINLRIPCVLFYISILVSLFLCYKPPFTNLVENRTSIGVPSRSFVTPPSSGFFISSFLAFFFFNFFPSSGRQNFYFFFFPYSVCTSMFCISLIDFVHLRWPPKTFFFWVDTGRVLKFGRVVFQLYRVGGTDLFYHFKLRR